MRAYLWNLFSLSAHGIAFAVSLLDTQVATLANVASSYLVSGRVPARMGTQHSSIVPYRAYEARDGHFIVGPFGVLCQLDSR